MSRSNSTESSPVSRFSGSDIDFFTNSQFDPTFTAEISNKMRVPKNIRIVGGHEVEGEGGNGEMNGNWPNHHSDYHQSYGRQVTKNPMQVPDRIIVTGQDHAKAAKTIPRELQLDHDTVVMPPDSEIIRIQTPPRSITLQNQPPMQMHHDSNDTSAYRSEEDDETLIVTNDEGARLEYFDEKRVTLMNTGGGGGNFGFNGARANTSSISRRQKRGVVAGDIGDDDEIDHLREQLSRMNRRLLAVEEDTVERKERERYIVLAGLFYVVYKTCAWLFKTGGHR